MTPPLVDKRKAVEFLKHPQRGDGIHQGAAKTQALTYALEAIIEESLLENFRYRESMARGAVVFSLASRKRTDAMALSRL